MGSPRTRTASRRPARPSVAKYVPSVPGEPKLLHVLERRPVPDPDNPDRQLIENGEPVWVEVTRADKIISYLKSNASLTACAAAVNVNPRTLHEWMREGAEAMAKAEAIRGGTAEGARLSKRERVMADFKARVDQTIAERQVQLAGTVTQMAQGGVVETVVTEKVELVHTDKGVAERLVERTTKTSTRGPSLPAALAILERRHEADWSPTKKVHVTGSGNGGPALTPESVGAVLDGIADKVAAKAASLMANSGATDAESTEDVVDAELVPDDDAGTELVPAARPE